MNEMPTREVMEGWSKEKTVPTLAPSDAIELPAWKDSMSSFESRPPLKALVSVGGWSTRPPEALLARSGGQDFGDWRTEIDRPERRRIVAVAVSSATFVLAVRGNGHITAFKMLLQTEAPK
jgi:hypothetical protein